MKTLLRHSYRSALIRLSLTSMLLASHDLRAAVILNTEDSFVLAGTPGGDLTLAGDLSVTRGIEFGTAATHPELAAVQLNYFGTPWNSASIDLTEPLGTYQWRDNLVTAARDKMQLDGANLLTLYKADGSGAGIRIDPNNSRIDLTGSGGGIYANGSMVLAVDAGGKLTFGSRSFSLACNTVSTSSTSGALTVIGGIGVGKDSYINGIRLGRGYGNNITNTVLGANAYQSAKIAMFNTAIGYGTLYSNTTGCNNTAVGGKALYYNTTGSLTVAIGTNCAKYQADGYTPLLTNRSIYIGALTRGSNTNDDNSIVIGCEAIGEGPNTTVIGNSETATTHLHGTVMASNILVNGYPVLTVGNGAANSMVAQTENASVSMSLGDATGPGATAMSGGSAMSFTSTAMSVGNACANYSTAMSFGIANADSSTAISYGRTDFTAIGSTSMSHGYTMGQESTAMSYGTTKDNARAATAISYGIAEGEASTAMTNGTARGALAVAAGNHVRADAFTSVALGSYNKPWGTPNEWVETDPLFQVGNGSSFMDLYALDDNSVRSNAITTLKNGQTTLTNKAWMANPDAPLADPDADTASMGEALVVEGHTRLKGKVIIEQAQGDISMGIYGDN